MATRLIYIGLVVFLLTILSGWSFNLTVNLTSSLPPGIYQIEPGRHITYGDIVQACPNIHENQKTARERGYLRYGICPGWFAPLLKRAAALPGDYVELTDGYIAVNGNKIPQTARLTTDSQGRKLPTPYFNGAVPSKEIWLLSNDSEYSYDARYFGAISLENVRGVAKPLWIF